MGIRASTQEYNGFFLKLHNTKYYILLEYKTQNVDESLLFSFGLRGADSAIVL